MISINLHRADCLDVLRALPDNSVDTILTDPPYGLGNTSPAQVIETLTAWLSGDREFLPSGRGFMGKAWDAFVPPVAVWDEGLRALKPGGHILAAAGSRTQDLMGLGMRLAGFELRDVIPWLYGSGFPKSMAVDKAIDKAAGATRDVLTERRFGGRSAHSATAGASNGGTQGGYNFKDQRDITAPATDAAKQWEGWGTALKPAYEPLILARKPLAGTVAANVLEYGTGALNIDASRIGTETRTFTSTGIKPGANNIVGGGWNKNPGAKPQTVSGRFPANVILDASQAEILDAQSGITKSTKAKADQALQRGTVFGGRGSTLASNTHEDQGGASRFFQVIEPDTQFLYQAKAPKSERPVVDGIAHPTVKPLALMRYLAKLITPPGGTILEPFAGSGTTVEAAILEGFNVIAIEREAEYIPLILERIRRTGTDVDLTTHNITPAAAGYEMKEAA